jgi:hypothetical protein
MEWFVVTSSAVLRDHSMVVREVSGASPLCDGIEPDLDRSALLSRHSQGRDWPAGYPHKDLALQGAAFFGWERASAILQILCGGVIACQHRAHYPEACQLGIRWCASPDVIGETQLKLCRRVILQSRHQIGCDSIGHRRVIEIERKFRNRRWLRGHVRAPYLSRPLVAG